MNTRTRLRFRGSVLASKAAAGAGHAVRFTGFAARLLPSLAGAGLASWSAWLIYRPAGGLVGAVFLLLAGERLATSPPGTE